MKLLDFKYDFVHDSVAQSAGGGYTVKRAHSQDFKTTTGLYVQLQFWTGDPNKKVTYQGKYVQANELFLNPQPVQRPRPPILIGGGGEQLTLRVVARLADKANFGGKPDEWAHKRDVLLGHCKDVGRDADQIELTWRVCSWPNRDGLLQPNFGDVLDESREPLFAPKPRVDDMNLVDRNALNIFHAAACICTWTARP